MIFINMKQLILALVLLTSLVGRSQTVIANDYIESQNWGGGGAGWSNGCGACWYSTSASVTPNQSASLRGNGGGSSGYESGTYILTNITALNPTKTYMFRFRAASYTFSAPAAVTAGVDVGDYFDVRYSINNGTSWTTEMRITGFSNATWNYNTNAIASKTANGSMTTYSPAAGGDRTSAGDGYSIIELTLPIGITQARFQVPTRTNANGEEWWFDDFELIELFALPAELISFTGVSTSTGNAISWITASESNTDYFLLERSGTGEFTENDVIHIIPAAGNSVENIEYKKTDRDYPMAINYYQLTQVDRDGEWKTYGPIAIDNTQPTKMLLKTVNMMGQEVDQYATGVLFEMYTDGTSRKIIR
jgi:hypothetical protein